MALSKKIVCLALLALISISTFFSSPGLSGLVLCLGNDGHFELENSVNGKCGSTAAASKGPSLAAPKVESHCGSCTDVSFLAVAEETFRQAQGIDLPKVYGPIVLQAGATLFFLERFTLGLLPQPPPLENQLLAHIRTIRLLV